MREIADRCHKISSKRLKPFQVLVDVTKEEDPKKLVESTVKEFGRIDILVNNAGVGITTPITEPNYMKVFKDVMQTNLNSVVFLTHLCVEHLAKTKGNIINNSSVVALDAVHLNMLYILASI